MEGTDFKNMLIISTPFRNIPSFSLIPTSLNCPYVEALYDPSSGILAVISKVQKKAFHMIPKLDDDGQPKKLKVPNKQTGKTVKEQRVSVETFSEFYITDKDEIKNFINLFGINSDTYDIDKFLEIDVKETKVSPLILST